MYGEQEILYGNATGYQLIGLPYKSRDVVMYILLPNGEFSAKVAIKQFDKMASSAKLENVTLVLPKVKLTTTVSVKDALTKCLKNKTEGVSRYANKKPSQNLTVLNELDTYLTSPAPLKVSSFFKSKHFDMSGASEDVRFKIDDIVHKVSMEIDELGTELVAATSTLVDHSGGNIILKVNRPFLFFVRHEITQTHLFWGFVANPTKTSKFHKNRMPMTCSTGKHN